ncbi:YggT family protein [Pseudovibrio sp. Tun.PSC04-5.I4]|uniref:YggT family protein n=1 Tax=Pseudovibrio sp. Tun.PSC04-5.I4 TaxID=1798213 RepID=UPI000889567D|nr:YggT family protein [Pseudovibrio sp. Tun.PSC04-5.I4]SDR28632.1 YggT family protein [Pseudovibrio sp. Tun.PSC04-5.I4]
MRSVLDVVFIILDLYQWVIIGNVIFSWLYAFNIVNTSNQFIATIGQTLHNLTEPLLRPIRRFLPSMGGLDLSPIILLIGLFFLKSVIARYIYPYVF